MTARGIAAWALVLLIVVPGVLRADAPADSAFAAATDTIFVPLHVSLPSDTLDLGRPFDARVAILHPGLSHVQLLVGPRGLEPLEVVDVRRELDTGDTTNVTLRLRAFRVGDVVAPPVVMAALTDEGVLAVGRSDSVRVTVGSIVPADAAGIRDIHGAVPLKPPFPWWKWALAVLAVLLLVVAVVLLRRRRRHALSARGVRITPADELALAALESLRSSSLAREGEWKAYYTELTNVLRNYLVRRFGVDAMDMTTTQTLRAAKDLDLDPDAVLALRHVLLQADSVKFAKEIPPADAPGRHLDETVSFVRMTRRPPAIRPANERVMEVAT